MATPEAKPPLRAVGAPAGKRIEVPIKKATGPGDDKVHTWPHLVRNEFLISIGIILLLIVWSLLVDAPLEEPANPTRTPNPSKAPWYFLGLQEMLVFFDPWHAGVVLPTFIILGLMVIPYLDINPKGNGYYCWKDRKWEILTFILGFHILWVSLIIIGTFVRGPGWNWFWFWEKWDPHKVEALTNVDLPFLLGVRDETMATIVGLLVVVGYFVVGYLAFQVYPQEAAFQAAKRAGAFRPQLLSSFAIQYPDSYRISQVDDLLWQAASGPDGNCALTLYQRVFPYGKHTAEAKQRPTRQEQGCALSVSN